MTFARTGLLFGASLCALVLSTAGASAQDNQRPLGILWLPGQEQNVPKPDIRSPLPPSVTAPQATAGQNTTPQAAAGTAGDRPLGTLFNTPKAPVYRAGSVLPQGWSSVGTAAPTAVSGTAPPANSQANRPLGTLIILPDTTPRTTASETTTIARQVPQIHPASRMQTTPTADASTARPLGTLFDTQVTPDTVGRTAAADIPPSRGGTPSRRTQGAPDSGDLPANLSADAMTYDRDLGLVTATGNVEITYGPRTLIAEKVTYNQKTDIARATGNVSLTDESGKIFFGDRMEITGDLKDGIIYNIGLILEDRSRVAGSGARRSNGMVTDIRNAVYSPCNLCPDDPNAAPLWQLKAVRVIHDSGEKQVSYRDVWLEVFGMPVAYSPYFTHPDPTVKRRSGFLAPSLSNSSDLGFRLEAPYFLAIDERQDATISPLVTTDGGSGLIGEYRRRFRKGVINSNGSFVADDPDHDFRGYVNFESDYHITPTWRAGLDIERASDDTFTRRYGFDTEPVLVTHAHLEGFRGHNYQSLSGYGFQDLRPGSDSDTTPIVIPLYDFNYSGKKDRIGGFTSFDFNALNLVRDTGTDTRRLAFRPRWERPFSGAFGELYSASVSLAADAYHSTNVTLDDGSNYTGASGRLIPSAEFSWRLPLIKPGPKISQTIEPLASIVLAPNGGNSDKIPNEDSQSIEFDETNLFQENRFDGFDRVDSGSRVNYGINYALNGRRAGNASFFLGQSYRPRVDQTFAQASGQTDNFSDIVGRVQINPVKYLNLLYRTQISPDNFSPQRNEITSQIGAPALSVSTNYIMINQQAGSEFSGREELSGSVSSKFNRYWSTTFSARNDLSESELRSLGLSLVYEDECVKLTTQLARSFFEDRDLKPADSITFTLVLKTLGEVRSGASLSQ